MKQLPLLYSPVTQRSRMQVKTKSVWMNTDIQAVKQALHPGLVQLSQKVKPDACVQQWEE